jgi:uncharacterized membrane protein YbhN (UPF0104 family)
VNGTWKRFAVAGFLLLSLLFVGLSLFDQLSAFTQLRGTIDLAWQIRVSWLAAALLLGTVNLLGMAGLWTWLTGRLGEPIGQAEGAAAWVGANLGRYIPGKVWQLAGLAVYMRARGRSGSVVLVSALVFQIVVLLTGVTAALLTLRGRIGLAFGGSPLLALLVGIGLVVLLHPAVLRRATGWLARLLGENGPEVTALIEEGRAGRGGATWALGAALMAAWWIYGAGLWCLVAAFAGPGFADIWTLTGVFAASYVAGYLAFVTPGGLVVREGAMILLIASLTPLPASVAAVIAVAARIWTIVSELVAFAVAAAWRNAEARETLRRESDAP